MPNQYKHYTFTPEQDAFIRQHYLDMSDAKMARALGCSPYQAMARRLKLGIAKLQKPWTQVEDDFIRDNFLQMTDSEIAKKLNRTKLAIRARKHKLGLKRHDDIARKMMLSTCFKKGHTPWNKGMKGVHLSPATEFKKGNLPHNIKHDGAITIRENNRGIPYKYIRVALGEWELLHRHAWAQHHGPVSDSHIVGFKNGDTLDCRIENLYCMSKADNARRNANREKAARSLRVYHQNGISDRHVAAYMTHDDPQMRALILEQHPQLIELKRLQLQLSKEIKHDKEPTA